ncbi:MAG: hypothetical protein AAFQ43_06225, partial [Bacteroidota bacterium]
EEYRDVIVVRSASAYDDPSTRADVTYTTVGGHTVTLTSGADEGFVRFRRYASGEHEYWATDPSQVYNLALPPEAFATVHVDATLPGGTYTNDVFLGATTLASGAELRLLRDDSARVLGTLTAQGGASVYLKGTLTLGPGSELKFATTRVKKHGRLVLGPGARLLHGAGGWTAVYGGANGTSGSAPEASGDTEG